MIIMGVWCPSHLSSSNLLASAVGNVDDVAVELLDRSEAARADRLVADGEVEVADLVNAVLADGVVDVVEVVVLGDPALGLAEARSEVVHAVRGRERQLAVLHEALALGSAHDLVVHVDTTTLVGILGGRLAVGEVVPGIVGDVVGTTRLVDAEEVEGTALVGDLDADVVAADGTRPVGDAVGVDLATDNTNAAGVFNVGSDAGRAGSTRRDGTGRDQSSRSSGDDSSEGGQHFDGFVCVKGDIFL